jgi:hypothetical protein
MSSSKPFDASSLFTLPSRSNVFDDEMPVLGQPAATPYSPPSRVTSIGLMVLTAIPVLGWIPQHYGEKYTMDVIKNPTEKLGRAPLVNDVKEVIKEKNLYKEIGIVRDIATVVALVALMVFMGMPIGIFTSIAVIFGALACRGIWQIYKNKQAMNSNVIDDKNIK